MDSGVCVERENVFFKNNTIEKVFVVSAKLVSIIFLFLLLPMGFRPEA